MRNILRALQYVVLVVLMVAAGGITYLYARKPAMSPTRDITVERTPERIARGKYLFRLGDCEGCHSVRDFSRFGGPTVEGMVVAGNVFPKEMGLPGVIAPPNLTPDLETGLGSWTDGEKIRAIREGVDRNGRTLFPMMPYERFRQMSDEDVYSLVAYLDSLPPVKHRVPPTKLDFPVSLMIKSAPQPVGHVPMADTGDRRKYGEYLVTIAGCAGCHAKTFSGGERFAVAPGVVAVSANISPDPHTGTGRWSEQDFVDRFTQYREYLEHGSPKVGPESFTVMPWLNFTQLRDEDLRAIYGYIHSQQPVYKAVETHPGFDPVTAKLLVSESK